MLKTAVTLAVLLLCCLSAICYALGDAYSTTSTSYASTGVVHPLNPKANPFWGPAYNTPYPTNTWWINLVLGMFRIFALC